MKPLLTDKLQTFHLPNLVVGGVTCQTKS